jgi:hypothetical protein
MKLVLIALYLVTVSPVQKPDGNTGKHGRASNDQPGTSVTFVDNRTSAPEEKPSQQKTPDWYATSAPAEWALFLAGTFGVIIALRTLRAINRQVAEMGQQREVMFGQMRAMHEQITKMEVQNAIAKESADAARDSIILTHRPRLIVRRIVLNTGTQIPTVGVPDAHTWTIGYAIVNQGGTRATILRQAFHFTEFKDEIPFRLDYDMEDLPQPIIVEPGQEIEDFIPIDNRLTTLFRMIGTRGDNFSHQAIAHTYFWGRIQYSDGNGIVRNVAVFRHYNLELGVFSVGGPVDYEYAD